MDTPFCQSCGMPMTATEHFGTNKDLTANYDYCCYCYNDGAFTQDLTMEEMIAHCAEFVDAYSEQAEQTYSKEEAIEQMRQYFPLLKRWR